MRQDTGTKTGSSIEFATDEPKEKSKQALRSCAERSCATGAGCITIVLIAIALLLRLFLGGGTEEIVGVPSQVPQNFPILERDSMHGSELTTTQHKSRLVQASLWWPRMLMALNANGFSDATLRTQAIENTMRDTLHASRDTVTLTWKKIPRDRTVWLQSYRDALTTAGYTILATTDTTIAFSADRVTGLLTIVDSEYTEHIDDASLVLHISQP
ncbi:MAG: hypothetical protein AAB384_01850 [Patescibacteria group bacterium]